VTEIIQKYPRTHHLQGSRSQPGDEDLESVPISRLAGGLVVIEEKLDGANTAFSFTTDGELRLQSRGHFLTGGYRERHYDLFKAWAHCHRERLWERMGDRYVVYGEWLYAKHRIFYDALPHYFLEFDVLDRASGAFLSTPKRRALLAGLPVVSVPVLWQGRDPTQQRLEGLVGPSPFKSKTWRERLDTLARERHLDLERVRAQTDPSDDLEGLYVKVETDDAVTHRFKFIRSTFLSSAGESESRWLTRPIVPNQLRPGVDLMS